MNKVTIAQQEYSDLLLNNLIEVNTTTSKRKDEGQRYAWDDRAVEIYKHEEGDAVTVIFYTQDKRTAHVAMSIKAAHAVIRGLMEVLKND